jgi:hypothetical protein
MSVIIKKIENWLQQEFPQQPLSDFQIIPIAHLSTPNFVFVMVEQKDMPGAGDLYLMTDEKEVLLASESHLAKVLAHEKFLEQQTFLTPARLAELYLRMGRAQPGSIITEADDFALKRLNKDASSQFMPPTIEQKSDGVVLKFWTSNPVSRTVARWEVQIDQNYNLAATEMVMG